MTWYDSQSDASSPSQLFDTLRRSNEHIQKWLQVNRLLHGIDNSNLLSKCIEQIIFAIGGHKQLLYFLSKFSDESELEMMHKIIKTNKLNHDNNIKSNTLQICNDINIKDDDDEEEEEEETISYFASLSNESISNICQYLSRSDIKSFKMTSRDIAIICLQQHTKINVYISEFNMHENAIQIKSRYHPETRFSSLLEEYSKKYNIPQQYILIFQRNDLNEFTLLNLTHLRSHSLSTLYWRTFMIGDSRKMVILDTKQGVIAKKMDEQYSITSPDQYRFIGLQYFDIAQQQMIFVQYLMYNKYNKILTFRDILEYIEHKFIYIEGITANNEWYKDLMISLKQMKIDPNHSKLCIYHNKYRNPKEMELIQDIDNKIPYAELYILCTFQINYNYNHKRLTLRQTDKFKVVKQNTNEFYLNALEFCRKEVFIDGHTILKVVRRTLEKYFRCTRVGQINKNKLLPLVNDEMLEYDINISMEHLNNILQDFHEKSLVFVIRDTVHQL